jgi:hypothetical protein
MRLPVAPASCRQMPPGRRRYIVHPISGHYTRFLAGQAGQQFSLAPTGTNPCRGDVLSGGFNRSAGPCAYRKYFSATRRNFAACFSTNWRSSRIVTPKPELRPGSSTPMLILSERSSSASVFGNIPFQ